MTFEPEATKHYCTVRNTAHLDNVEVHHAALGDDSNTTARMRLDVAEKGNSGAHYCVPDGDIPVMVIDEMNLPDVDLIYLDVEGSEAPALVGATDTIMRCRPVIGVEDKNLYLKRNNPSPGEILLHFGYKSIGRPFALDEIWVPQ